MPGFSDLSQKASSFVCDMLYLVHDGTGQIIAAGAVGCITTNKVERVEVLGLWPTWSYKEDRRFSASRSRQDRPVLDGHTSTSVPVQLIAQATGN